MSRAFVNEDAGNDRPDLPELPVPPGPNIVTPRGLASLQARRRAGGRTDAGGDYLAGARAHFLAERRARETAKDRSCRLAALASLQLDVAAGRDCAELHGRGRGLHERRMPRDLRMNASAPARRP